MTEEFKASCKGDHVIDIQTAMYGRMHIGRCVSTDYGHLGCEANVRTLTDRRCSGRHQCQIAIPDREFETTRPCPVEFIKFFEVEYRCTKGMTFMYLFLETCSKEAQFGSLNIFATLPRFACLISNWVCYPGCPLREGVFNFCRLRSSITEQVKWWIFYLARDKKGTQDTKYIAPSGIEHQSALHVTNSSILWSGNIISFVHFRNMQCRLLEKMLFINPVAVGLNECTTAL